MAVWIELFDGPAGEIYADLPDPLPPNTDFQKPSVHEWQRHGDETTGGETHVSGTGGLDQLQPLAINAFATFGGLEHKWDAGIIRFQLGDALKVLPPGKTFGVHFNTNKGAGMPNENSGYAVFVISAGDNGQGGALPVQVQLARITGGARVELGVHDTPGVLPGDVVEVRWGYSTITALPHEPGGWGIDVFVGDPGQPQIDAIISYTLDDVGDDTDPHLAGGYVGVAAYDEILVSTENLITRFEFQDLIKKLSDPAVLGTPYKSGPDMPEFVYGLHAEPTTGAPSNEIPDDWETYAMTKAGEVVPRDLLGNQAPLYTEGLIGFVSIGLSNTGQIWSAFARMANDPDFVVDPKEPDFKRNPSVRIVNGARAETEATEWADPNHQVWPGGPPRHRRVGVAMIRTRQPCQPMASSPTANHRCTPQYPARSGGRPAPDGVPSAVTEN